MQAVASLKTLVFAQVLHFDGVVLWQVHATCYFYATCFILHFLLRTFFKSFGGPLHLLTVHPKLRFRGALEKGLMVPEDRSYQT